MAFKDTLLYLSKILYPNGRAFKVLNGGEIESLHKAIIGDAGTPATMAQAKLDADNILDVMIPDNDNFTLDDARFWYHELGIFDSGSIPLSDMKLAILQRMSYPLVPINVQTAGYIQAQLHAAGFTNCNVYRNNFGSGGEAISPGGAGGLILFGLEPAICGEIQCGQTDCGQTDVNSAGFSKCVNYIEDIKDIYFDAGDNFRSTFYIANILTGTYPGPYLLGAANVPLVRKQEFRQLILKLKAQSMCAFLFINYV